MQAKQHREGERNERETRRITQAPSSCTLEDCIVCIDLGTAHKPTGILLQSMVAREDVRE